MKRTKYAAITLAGINNFFTQATMCEYLVNWTGSGEEYPAARTLHTHEIADHASNY
jgi:hypothetical protein